MKRLAILLPLLAATRRARSLNRRFQSARLHKFVHGGIETAVKNRRGVSMAG